MIIVSLHHKAHLADGFNARPSTASHFVGIRYFAAAVESGPPMIQGNPNSTCPNAPATMQPAAITALVGNPKKQSRKPASRWPV